MKYRISFLLTLCVVFLSVTKTAEGQKRVKTTEVIILATNDMHARIDNFGKLAYLADSLRKGKRHHLFLVAAGDNFTGNPIVDMYPDKGYPMIDLMNRLHYDVTAMGNHEFDLGQENLNKRREQANFPFISCNIDASGAIVKPFEPYVILKAGKLKIPFLGIIQLGANGLPDSHPSRLEGVKFTNGIVKAQEYKWLKEKYGILIGLSHLGVEDDQPLANAMPEFDVIIGGHSHTVLSSPMMTNNVMIEQAGSGLKYVGKITLTITNGKVTGRGYELIALSNIKKTNPEIQAIIDKYNGNEEMNRPVATAETPFSSQEELGCLMTDAITSRMKVDFAFQNSGGIRISSLPQGEIKFKDIFRLDPFGNQVVTFSLTYNELKSLVLNSYNRDKKLDLAVSGMSYTIITDPSGQSVDVEMKDTKGNLLDQAKTYSVGVNSYISATYKFDHKDPGTTNYNTSAQTLLDYLSEVKSVNYTGCKRAFVKK